MLKIIKYPSVNQSQKLENVQCFGEIIISRKCHKKNCEENEADSCVTNVNRVALPPFDWSQSRAEKIPNDE